MVIKDLLNFFYFLLEQNISIKNGEMSFSHTKNLLKIKVKKKSTWSIEVLY